MKGIIDSLNMKLMKKDKETRGIRIELDNQNSIN